MPLSIAHGNGIKNFLAVTKIDALIWGAQRRNKKGARWRTSGRAILILFVAD
jgi:hypothetical protein